jgi:arginine decarboxylase
MPIHRLNEEPNRRAVLADITCDSDGKIDKFIDLRDIKSTLELHNPNGQDYYLGVFLIGAYQEILGDMHNLFGDSNAVHVTLSDDGEYFVTTSWTATPCRRSCSTCSTTTRICWSGCDERRSRPSAEEDQFHGVGRACSDGYEQGLKGYTYLRG